MMCNFKLNATGMHCQAVELTPAPGRRTRSESARRRPACSASGANWAANGAAACYSHCRPLQQARKPSSEIDSEIVSECPLCVLISAAYALHQIPTASTPP